MFLRDQFLPLITCHDWRRKSTRTCMVSGERDEMIMAAKSQEPEVKGTNFGSIYLENLLGDLY